MVMPKYISVEQTFPCRRTGRLLCYKLMDGAYCYGVSHDFRYFPFLLMDLAASFICFFFFSVSFFHAKERTVFTGMYQIREANQMVEEFMLAANISVAEKILKHFPLCSLLR